MKRAFDRSPDFAGKTVHLPNFTAAERTAPAEKGRYVLYFGSYGREKGVETLLWVARRHPDIPFVFAGSGPLAGSMRGLPNVRDLGYLGGEELRGVVARASLAVVPSECPENSPFAVLEALSAGTPVLGARAGGIPELVADGVTGELFGFRDASDLERRLVSLWGDPGRLARYAEGCASFDPMSPARYLGEIECVYEEAALGGGGEGR
jgi:glycosyltransferase involved in cell wall biosynthesis